jgi:hypothetical protein
MFLAGIEKFVSGFPRVPGRRPQALYPGRGRKSPRGCGARELAGRPKKHRGGRDSPHRRRCAKGGSRGVYLGRGRRGRENDLPFSHNRGGGPPGVRAPRGARSGRGLSGLVGPRLSCFQARGVRGANPQERPSERRYRGAPHTRRGHARHHGQPGPDGTGHSRSLR